MKSSPIVGHQGQLTLWRAQRQNRFVLAGAGRRFGKTFYSKEKLLQSTENRRHLYWYVAPTRAQAKDLMWEELKDGFRHYGWKFSKSESDLSITRIRTQTRIVLKSAERPDRLRGKGLNGVVCDEYADFLKEVWTECLRPALSDKRGWGLFMGTPKGFNHFYELFQDAKTREGWAALHFKTSDSPFFQTPEGIKELQDARRDLDERTFRQEYEASFENFAGRIIYAFDRTIHHTDYDYDPNLPIYIGQDFNRNPMAGVLFQKVSGKLIAFNEMVIPTSSTDEVCLAVKQKYPNWTNTGVIVRPDSTGNRTYSATTKSDHQIMKEHGFQVDALPKNPNKVDRWQATNRAFERGMVLVNTKKCKVFTRELETICYKEGACEPHLTSAIEGHTFDGGQYCIYKEFPIIVQQPIRIQHY
jgi:hypothetical protein